MDKARFFGECPQLAYNGATALITVGSTGPATNLAPAKGVASILVLTDTTFTAITLAFPIAGSVNLAGVVIPAGVTLYGIRSYQVATGAGIAYHSHI